MKTIYEKTLNLTKYMKDIMFMQRYYLDIYPDINVVRWSKAQGTPREFYDSIRGYSFASQDYNQTQVFHSIQQRTDYFTRNTFTITSSDSHIRNNMPKENSASGYKFIMYPQGDDINAMFNAMPSKNKDLYNALKEGINTKTVRETEFQMQLLYTDMEIQSYYMVMLLNNSLLRVQHPDHDPVVLCMGSIDIQPLIPARKAMIDLLKQRASNYDWKNAIQLRYEHTIG